MSKKPDPQTKLVRITTALHGQVRAQELYPWEPFGRILERLLGPLVKPDKGGRK